MNEFTCLNTGGCSVDVDVWNSAGSANIDFLVTADASWITGITPSSGTCSGTPVSFNFFVDPSGLDPGSYTAEVTVTALSAWIGNSPITITVNLQIP